MGSSQRRLEAEVPFPHHANLRKAEIEKWWPIVVAPGIKQRRRRDQSAKAKL